MKKALALILAAVMMLSLAACGGGGDADSSGGSTPPQSGTPASGAPSGGGTTIEKIAMILPGVITDESWNYTAYEGLMQLQDAGYEVTYLESMDVSTAESVARNFVAEGYQLVFAHGSQFGDSMIRVAEDCPEQYFFVYGQPPADEYPDNCGFVDVAVYQGTFVCGALAALMSESGSIGYIGGTESAGQLSMKNGYIQGAEYINPDIQVQYIMAGVTDDPAKGREAAIAMIDQGADVIMHAADTTGLGVIEACIDSNVYVIGYGSDQHDLAPELMLTSVLEIVPPVIVQQAEAVADGTFGGVYQPGLGVGVDLGTYSEQIPSDVMDQVEEIVAGVTDGSIEVVQSFEK